MHRWSAFEARAPEIAAAGRRLLNQHEVAFLATVSAAGRPRIHPFVWKIVEGALVGFIIDRSPKRRDLDARRHYAIHSWLGEEDEEFYVAGEAAQRNSDTVLRKAADAAMGYATGSADEHHILYEFLIDQALWTTWADFGTPKHRPVYRRWRAH
jgi:hypothetical protein